MVRLVALDDKSEHVQDVITILVEAASWQRITPGNLFGLLTLADPYLFSFQRLTRLIKLNKFGKLFSGRIL